MRNWKKSKTCFFSLSCFTQLSSASRFSTKYWCNFGPSPDGDTNCLTIDVTRSCCCCVNVGSIARKYSVIVSSNSGTGSFGNSYWKMKFAKRKNKETLNKTETFKSFLYGARVVSIMPEMKSFWGKQKITCLEMTITKQCKLNMMNA